MNLFKQGSIGLWVFNTVLYAVIFVLLIRLYTRPPHSLTLASFGLIALAGVGVIYSVYRMIRAIRDREKGS